jgi:hypothetical protein
VYQEAVAARTPVAEVKALVQLMQDKLKSFTEQGARGGLRKSFRVHFRYRRTGQTTLRRRSDLRAALHGSTTEQRGRGHRLRPV